MTDVMQGGRLRRRVLIALAATAVVGTAVVGAGPRTLTASAAMAPSTRSLGYAVSQATDPTSGNIYLAAQGPGHSLFFYWDLSGTWYGPIAIGAAGTTFSAPSVTVDSSHHVVVAAQGPDHRLYFYWNVSGTWHGPLQVGATGAAVSTPTLISDQDGHLDLAVQSPGQTLSFYWNVAATWYGPSGLGTAGKTVSTPSITSDTGSPHRVYVAAQGPNNSLIVYANTTGTWAAPAQSSPQTTFAAPSASQNYFYVQGAGNDLDNWNWNATPDRVSGDWPIGPGDVTLSAPSAAGNSAVAAIGPSNSLFFYWYSQGWNGPLGVGGAGSSWSIPSSSAKSNSDNPTIAVEGPNNSLFFYWNVNGTWHGPLGVGAPGSTFSSPN